MPDPFSLRRELQRSTLDSSWKVAKGGEEAVDFVGGVVVDQADAQEAAFGFDAETLGEVEGVVVAVAGEDGAVGEELGDFGGVMIADDDGDGGAAPVEARWVGDAEDADAGNGVEAVEKASEKRHFVLVGDAVGGEERAAAVADRGIVVAADRGEIVHRGGDSGD